ncbi:GerAB/ArcD/ProY family transporter [Bacillus sp. T33-2]|uniref:GerAB/ArcD/ProY family transporter n=1 Tax=Bacillus sp. T33-2 TaxID=2054168 RepID=UPI000C76E6B6|nr:GerAB/ArcD/ProY family transporter [Bacillus sp. T33-2]PLR92582.1 spore gernimation protein GerB [Bacillus sp. T33-2]
MEVSLIKVQQLSIPETRQVSPSLALYLVVSMQIGIGVLGFQRLIAESAGHDAWISVLVAGLSIHIIVWMIYKICETVDGDLVSANVFILGKKLGKMISSLFIVYYICLSITVLRSYLEVIQVWMFPELSTFWFSLVFLLLVLYILYGGFRTVTGVAYFCTILPSYLLLTFAFTLEFAEFRNLLPILDHPLTDILKSTYRMSLTYAGYEILLFCYPFIKEPDKSKKWAHLGVFITTIVYTTLAILSFAYYSEGLLSKSVWSTLDMWKIVTMPFVERFEYIGIANWSLVILPNVCLAVWSGSRIVKRISNFPQKNGIVIITLICLVAINFFNTRHEINMLNDWTGKLGFIFTFIYIPLLFIAVMVAKKVKRK